MFWVVLGTGELKLSSKLFSKWKPRGHSSGVGVGMRPLWILLLNDHKEEALGIFLLKVVCLLCCFSLVIFCCLLHVKNHLVKNLEDMSNSWKLEMEKK